MKMAPQEVNLHDSSDGGRMRVYVTIYDSVRLDTRDGNDDHTLFDLNADNAKRLRDFLIERYPLPAAEAPKPFMIGDRVVFTDADRSTASDGPDGLTGTLLNLGSPGTPCCSFTSTTLPEVTAETSETAAPPVGGVNSPN